MAYNIDIALLGVVVLSVIWREIRRRDRTGVGGEIVLLLPSFV